MKNNMPTYLVRVTIENKSGISDPEGETILNDLVLKGNYSSISKIRSGKILKFQVDEKNKKLAEERINKLCDELRIFNPLVSQVTFEVFDN
jgi:phosphoribosylformylglycinamidine synthase